MHCVYIHFEKVFAFFQTVIFIIPQDPQVAIMRLEIDGWDSHITFSACHFIPGHEKCDRLHGHIYSISAQIWGEQKEDGMIFDFMVLKRALRSIADELDHRVLLPGNSKRVKIDVNKNVEVQFDRKKYSFPVEDVAILDIEVASAEELAKFVLERLFTKIKFSKNIERVEIGVDEGRGQKAWAQKVL